MIAGMDAVITFTKNPDGPSSLRDTNVLDMLGKIFTEHRKQPAVVWRICFASASIAMFSPDSGSEIARINFHEPLVASFDPFRVTSPPDAICYSILGILGEVGLGQLINASNPCFCNK